MRNYDSERLLSRRRHDDEVINLNYELVVGERDSFFRKEFHFLCAIYDRIATPTGNETLLDVCCGVGAQGVTAARCGYSVAAVDHSVIGLSIASMRAREIGVSVNYIAADCQEHRERSPTARDRLWHV
jgi:2-polyprenyl-3-methyl-5-hydroxy-6-metoxy-1,4-benzoquinol methylase